MDIDRIDVDKIEDITTLYDLLDIHALELQQKHKIDNLWYKYRDKTQSDIEKQKSQWEVEVFIFSILGGRVFSLSTSNGKNIGEISQYPVLDKFQIEAFEYIKLRAKSTKSSVLLARYNHILWKGLIAKDRSYGLLAIENYIKTIYDYYDLFLIKNENSTLHQIGKLYENTLALVNELKYYIDEFKTLTNFLLHNEKLKFYVKHGVISDMLQFPKIFKPGDFNNILELFDEYIRNSQDEDNDFNLAESYLPNAAKIAQKTGLDVKKWHNEIGLAYLRIADRETREGAEWIKLHHYANAIHAFERAGNIKSKENTEQLYFELKPLVKFNEFGLDFNENLVNEFQKSQEELKKNALFLLKRDPLDVYMILSKIKISPSHNDLAPSKKNKNHFLDFAVNIKLDKNKNIRKGKSDNEKQVAGLNEDYSIQISMRLLPYLHYVFVTGIKSGHLTYTNLIEYLVQYTWIGIPHHKTDSGGNIKTTNWVKLLAPSICEYFIQVQAWGESKYYVPSFILCIDSLTLKIEGLFRNYAERLNISTSMGKKGEMQEALLHDLLDNDIIKSTINEDDRLLFNYVFSNNGGRNLRNNVAHSFYTDKEYDNDKMLLLLAVLLRLSSYNIEQK